MDSHKLKFCLCKCITYNDDNYYAGLSFEFVTYSVKDKKFTFKLIDDTKIIKLNLSDILVYFRINTNDFLNFLEYNHKDIYDIVMKKESIFRTNVLNGNNNNATISKELYDYLDYLGIIPNKVRDSNVGKSNYSNKKHLIQPWTIWLDYQNLTSFDHDIIKRILREKEEYGMTLDESRILDYEKIIHIAQERIRQIKAKAKIK